jgi:hypothetical protein
VWLGAKKERLALTDPWEPLEFLRQLINGYESDIMIVLCAAAVAISGLLTLSLLRGRKLEKQVDALHLSIQMLVKAEENRINRERRSRTKHGAPE